jgi:hypothetical protein
MEIGIEPTVRHGTDLGYIPSWLPMLAGLGTRRRPSDLWPASASRGTRCLLRPRSSAPCCTHFRRTRPVLPAGRRGYYVSGGMSAGQLGERQA